jgi:tetratricopeptide (TPR) repeat protein/tRNA A-37 threonylcarbamoyl transferase component Bud32
MSDAPTKENASLAQQRHVDQVCQRFEAAWKSGQRPRIEDYLGDTAEPGQSALLRELIPLDADYRRLAGETPRLEDYQRFPNLDPAWLASVLAAPEPAAAPGTPLPLESTGPVATSPTPRAGDSGQAAASAVPTDSGRYQPLRFHARGALGEVHVALDAELHREVALKRIQPPRADDPDSRRRFLLEAEITGRLEHPGIVPVYGLVQDADGQPCYAMRFIQGESLQEAIKRFHEADKGGRDPGERSLALRQLLSRFIAVCNAVAYAHSRGIVHRDLKPANVMLGKYGETLLVDWGLAKAVARGEEARAGGEDTLAPTATGDGNGTAMGQAVGTPAYMSPEQASGRWDLVGPASDIYGLGATLYAVLTGQPPFKGEPGALPPGALLERVKRGEFPRPRKRKAAVPPPLEAVCLKAMARKPEDRYATALGLAADVEHWLADEPVSAYAEGWATRARRWTRRHRVLVTGVAVAVVAAVLLGGGLGWLLLEERADRRVAGARREATMRPAVENTLELVVKLRQEARWEEAEAALKLALSRLGEEGAADLRQRLVQAQADLRLVKRLDEIRLKRLILVSGKLNLAGAAEAYEAAFREQGLDIRAADAATLGRQVAASPVRDHLLAALDDWALTGSKDGNRLLAIARRADPDRLRNQFRNPHLWKDRKQLEKLAAQASLKSWSPMLLLYLGKVLEKAGGDGISLMRQAQEWHPRDYWITYGLANSLSTNRRKRWDEAVGYYRAAIALRPRESAAYADLGSTLYYKGDLDGAIIECRKAIAINPKDSRAFNNLGVALHDQGDLKGAMAAYQKAITLDPKNVEAHNNLGNALRDNKNLGGAIAEYKQAIALEARWAPAHVGLGDALKAKGHLKEAIAEYRKAIGFDPKDSEAHTHFGDALREKRHLKRAIAEHRRAIALDPSDAVAHYNLGLALQDKKDLAGAIAAYEKAIALDPKNSKAYTNLGNALNAKGNLARAIAAYKKAIDINPKDAVAHYNLGNALSAKRDLPGAIAEFQKAIYSDPKYALAYNNLGFALQKQGHLDAAISWYKKAIAIDRKYALAHHNLGDVLYSMRDLDGAIAEYKKAIAIDGKYVKAHSNLGVALMTKGDPDGAIAAFQKAIDIDPTQATVHNNLGFLLLQSRRDLKQAIASFRKAITLNPKLALAHRNLGNALYAKRDLAGAIAEYRKAIALDPKDGAAHFNLGVALDSMGDLKQAIAQYRKARTLAPKLVIAHNNLGNALLTAGDFAGAITAFQKAIALNPKYAPAHGGMGQALLSQGHFVEASASTQRALDLLSPGNPLRNYVTQQLQQCERFRKLDAKLPNILNRKAQPAGAAERVALADLCQQYKKRFAAAARFYSDAFKTNANLATDLRFRHRYNAACAAALAGAGQGEDAGKLTIEERARWRKQARDWLRSELGLWKKQLERNIPQVRAFVGRFLHDWQRDPDLAGVRDEEELVWLVAEERRACRQLWVEVEELLKRSQDKK